jgi:hypothetical protein
MIDRDIVVNLFFIHSYSLIDSLSISNMVSKLDCSWKKENLNCMQSLFIQSFLCLFFNIGLFIVMPCTYDVWTVEKLSMGIVFILESWSCILFCVKLFCETSLSNRLLPNIEVERIVLEASPYEHHLFVKKNKLVCETIFLNVINLLLHHVTCVKSAKNFETIFE